MRIFDVSFGNFEICLTLLLIIAILIYYGILEFVLSDWHFDLCPTSPNPHNLQAIEPLFHHLVSWVWLFWISCAHTVFSMYPYCSMWPDFCFLRLNIYEYTFWLVTVSVVAHVVSVCIMNIVSNAPMTIRMHASFYIISFLFSLPRIGVDGLSSNSGPSIQFFRTSVFWSPRDPRIGCQQDQSLKYFPWVAEDRCPLSFPWCVTCMRRGHTFQCLLRTLGLGELPSSHIGAWGFISATWSVYSLAELNRWVKNYKLIFLENGHWLLSLPVHSWWVFQNLKYMSLQFLPGLLWYFAMPGTSSVPGPFSSFTSCSFVYLFSLLHYLFSSSWP